MVTGLGTKEDPYIVSATYYYQCNQFDQESVNYISTGVNAFNKLGMVKLDSGVYVKFDLSLKEVEVLDDALIDASIFEDNAGNTHRSATFIHPQNEITAWATASFSNINIIVDKIRDAALQGADIDELFPMIVSHEVAHNLGAQHTISC